MLFKLNIKRTNNQLNYSTFVTKRVYKDNVISTIVDLIKIAQMLMSIKTM